MHESYANVVFPLWSIVLEVREEENILGKKRVKKIGNEKKKIQRYKKSSARISSYQKHYNKTKVNYITVQNKE